MPQLKKKLPFEKVVLPGSSTPEDEAYVMMDVDFRGGDIIDLVGKENVQGMNAREITYALACSLVKEWNFVDETGNPLPVTMENVRLLPPADLTIIVNKAQVVKQGLSSTKKKS